MFFTESPFLAAERMRKNPDETLIRCLVQTSPAFPRKSVSLYSHGPLSLVITRKLTLWLKLSQRGDTDLLNLSHVCFHGSILAGCTICSACRITMYTISFLRYIGYGIYVSYTPFSYICDIFTYHIPSQSLAWNLKRQQPGIGDSFWKPSSLGLILNSGRVSVYRVIFHTIPSISYPKPSIYDIFTYMNG